MTNTKKVSLTKAQMVEQIQLAEARAWYELRKYKELFGEDDNITKSKRNEWSALYQLREGLGIPSLSVSQLIELQLM
jgi:hypothetical protein